MDSVWTTVQADRRTVALEILHPTSLRLPLWEGASQRLRQGSTTTPGSMVKRGLTSWMTVETATDETCSMAVQPDAAQVASEG